MNKPVHQPDRHGILPSLAERFRPAVESGVVGWVGEAAEGGFARLRQRYGEAGD